MVFSSPIFLFLFLPITLGVYFVLPKRARNIWLLAASLVFYGWGEPKFLAVMLASIACNFVLALWIARLENRRHARRVLALAVTVNIGLLVAFKYTDFIVQSLNAGLRAARRAGADGAGDRVADRHLLLHLPCLVVCHRRLPRGCAVRCATPFDMGLYISLFSQLIAGPIIRYHEIAGAVCRSASVTRTPVRARRPTIHRRASARKCSSRIPWRVSADLIFTIPGDAADDRARLAGRALLHAADLLRFLRLFGHGHRSRR